MATSIQYVSDLHLEFLKYPEAVDTMPIERRAPYLVLAGDVGNPCQPPYARFLHRVSAMFDRVFLITGNHEYYGSTLLTTDNVIKSLVADLSNVVFLQNSLYSDPTLAFDVFGGTMWSAIDPSERKYVKNGVSDYVRIDGGYERGGGFLPELSTRLFHSYQRALEATLAQGTKPLVVISHHMPSRSLIAPQYKNTLYNSAFATDVSLANHPRIVAWFYGHTHAPHDEGIFHCNPVGYPGENKTYDLNKVVTIALSV